MNITEHPSKFDISLKNINGKNMNYFERVVNRSVGCRNYKPMTGCDVTAF